MKSQKIFLISVTIEDFRVGEFVQMSNTVESHFALFYGSDKMDEKLGNRFRVAFACRLAYSAPKPFSDSVCNINYVFFAISMSLLFFKLAHIYFSFIIKSKQNFYFSILQRYSSEAKSYFTEKCMDSQVLDIHVVKVSRTNTLEVEILLPGGGNIFDEMCQL